ncbi:group II intron reverse transcriptase/maturase [uncultured Porphyromonas sp.]|uniref:group II intron reverse transcriptase/maturase n=1 Tax=uncultured Porphyromonas sp. TaxID=159274 RepID=UPI00262CA17E|nr:group II intron reverse transcriptase/maturase [uncultured Porphyromonas sp.]
MKLIEQILAKNNVREALNRVVSNKGASGIDGMKVEELRDYMNANWTSIKQSILERRYKPAPVRRVEIPKPNGGVRKLGIPTVVDRTLQQSIVQVLTPIFEAEFQENSYGFRPGRSCEQAVQKLLEYLNEGAEWIVDIDLEKFFDNVPQDKLMSYVGRVIQDPDTESLIRKYLKSGVMENGLYEATELGTPQGGNLSPLLSNVMLNELDKELVRRGLRYVRYADDCVIAVGSEASAKRVMHSVTQWIERVLGLKVNATKTHVCRPSKLKYLGFGFYKSPQSKQWTARPHEDSVTKFVRKLKKLCKRSWSISMTARITMLNRVIRGWINYFAIGAMKGKMATIDEHLRTMLRKVIWKQWKTPRKRAWGLRKLGICNDLAKLTSYSGDRYEWVVRRTCVVRAISKDVLARRGLVSCLDYYAISHSLKTN